MNIILIKVYLLEQLKDRLNLNVDEMDKLTLEDLRRQVDHGVREVSHDGTDSSGGGNRQSFF